MGILEPVWYTFCADPLAPLRVERVDPLLVSSRPCARIGHLCVFGCLSVRSRLVRARKGLVSRSHRTRLVGGVLVLERATRNNKFAARIGLVLLALSGCWSVQQVRIGRVRLDHPSRCLN